MVVKKSNKPTMMDRKLDTLRGRKEVYRIPLSKDEKQILVLRGANIPEDNFKDFVITIQEWAKSDDPILVMQVSATVEVQMVKVKAHGR